jgi:hypothetical protein
MAVRSARASRLSVWGRVLTAFPLGYATTSLLVMALARLLPGSRADATVFATLLSFGIYAGLVVYVFAAPSAWRAFAVTLLIGAGAGGVAWASIAMGGRL